MPDSVNNLTQLLSGLEETLVEIIPSMVKAMAVKQKAYCLFLVYHDTSVIDYRPNLVVGLESLRKEMLDTEPHAVEIVWNPGLLDTYALCPGCCCEARGLEETCGVIYRALTKDWGDGRSEEDMLLPVRRTMHRVAKRLNLLDWSGLLDTTDDFVVVAIDDHGFDPYADLKACVGAERIALLDSRGLLGSRAAQCPKCGAELRTPKSRQCFECGADWH